MDTQNGGLEKVAPEKQLFLVSMVELKGYKLRLSLCYPPPTIQPVQHLWYCNSICQSGPHTGWRDKPVVNNPKTIDLVPKEMCRAPSALWIDPRIIWAVTPNLIVVLVQDLQARNLTRMLKNGALERCSISVYPIPFEYWPCWVFSRMSIMEKWESLYGKKRQDFCGDFTGLFGGGTLLFPSEKQESGC